MRWKFGPFVPNSNKFVVSNWASCELIKTACYISFSRFPLHIVVGIISTRLIVSLSNRISFWNSLLYNYHRSQWIVGQDRLRGADAWTACGNMVMEKHLQYVAWINQRLSEKLLKKNVFLAFLAQSLLPVASCFFFSVWLVMVVLSDVLIMLSKQLNIRSDC